MMTDSIAQFLTGIRNALQARHKKVDVGATRARLAIVEILKTAGFIKDFRLYRVEQKGILRIYLKYIRKDEPAIQGLRRISKPSLRVYSRYDKLPKIRGGIGVAVVSTSKGILTDRAAREQHVGGEVMCTIW